MILADFIYSIVSALWLSCPKDIKIIWLSNILTLNVPDKSTETSHVHKILYLPFYSALNATALSTELKDISNTEGIHIYDT